MWVVGFWNLPYAKQDTNVAIESYNTYLINSELWKNFKIKKKNFESLKISKITSSTCGHQKKCSNDNFT